MDNSLGLIFFICKVGIIILYPHPPTHAHTHAHTELLLISNVIHFGKRLALLLALGIHSIDRSHSVSRKIDPKYKDREISEF